MLYLFTIFKRYKFYTLGLFFYEIKYLLLGYDNIKINIKNLLNNNINIPTSFFFLEEIFFFFKNKNPKSIIDLGCGSGRVLNFFKKKFPKIKTKGIEINKNTIFLNNNLNIEYGDITKFKFKKIYDIIVINDPLKKHLYKLLLKKIIDSPRLNKYIVLINIDIDFKLNFKTNLICVKYKKLGRSSLKIFKIVK